MEFIKTIEKYDQRRIEIKEAKKDYQNKLNEINDKYSKDPCDHSIVIKLYSSAMDFYRKIPSYYCLGCQAHSSFLEDETSHKIIDLTCCEDGSTYIGDQNKLVAYISLLAKEVNEKLPTYTNSDFVEMINQNREYIKVPNN